MADGLWGAFFRMTGNQHCTPEELSLIRDARNGTGLARPDHFDWNTELDTLIGKSAPTLIFASIGLNELLQIGRHSTPPVGRFRLRAQPCLCLRRA